jgi:hypothetical protein
LDQNDQIFCYISGYLLGICTKMKSSIIVKTAATSSITIFSFGFKIALLVFLS